MNCKMTLLGACSFLASAGMLLTSPAFGQGVTIKDIVNDQKTTGDILTNGLGPRGQRYSPMNKINKSNVSSLVPAWAFSTGGEKQRGFEAQPLVHNGVIYITGSYSRMWAIDAKTGEELWQYNARLPEGILRHIGRQAGRAECQDR